MRTVLFGLALSFTCLAETPDVVVVVPPSAAHPQDWLHPQLRVNPNPDHRDKSASSLAEFVAPEVISKIVVDQYAGPPDDVRRYLTALPTAAAQYFGPSLELCAAGANPNAPSPTGAWLVWTSTSTVTFQSGRSGRLAGRVQLDACRSLAEEEVAVLQQNSFRRKIRPATPPDFEMAQVPPPQEARTSPNAYSAPRGRWPAANSAFRSRPPR